MLYAELLFTREAVLKQCLYIDVPGLILHTPDCNWMSDAELSIGDTAPMQFNLMGGVDLLPS